MSCHLLVPRPPVSRSHPRPEWSSPHTGPGKYHLPDTGNASVLEPVGNFRARNVMPTPGKRKDYSSNPDILLGSHQTMLNKERCPLFYFLEDS